jgi:hypothetical protein
LAIHNLVEILRVPDIGRLQVELLPRAVPASGSDGFDGGAFCGFFPRVVNWEG